MYGVTVRHFAQRTRKNLASIERLSRDEPHKYFEITQLINSSVGLLMFPQQEFFDAVPATPLIELAIAGWPIPTFEHGGEKTRDLRQLLRYMRNSFAHYNIDFKPERGKIVGLYLWNRAAGSPDWLCYITVSDLRTLFEKFSKLAENIAAGTYSEVRVHHIRSEIARSKRS